jgi:hypothetical protein
MGDEAGNEEDDEDEEEDQGDTCGSGGTRFCR